MQRVYRKILEILKALRRKKPAFLNAGCIVEYNIAIAITKYL